MTKLTTTFPPVVVPRAEVLLEELRSDLAALGGGQGPAPRELVLTQPHLLRTLAATAAAHVPRGVDRLVATAADAALVTAVALYTGLRFSIVDVSTTPVHTTGPLHPGESAALIGYHDGAQGAGDDPDHTALVEHLERAQVHLVARVIVPTPEQAAVVAQPGASASDSAADSSGQRGMSS